VPEHLTLTLSADSAVDREVRQSARLLCLEAFGDRFGADDWDHSCGGVRVLASDGSELVAHAAVVPRRMDVGGVLLDAGYVEAVAVRPGRWRQGLGSRVMAAATSHIRAAHQIGLLSTSRQGFYERLGWERWLGPSFVRRGATLARTPDEDDGLMVLRFGPSAGLDRSCSVTCEERTGDDW
jgi:aminoglycoside 2'-N-acetyltransferase I